MATNVHQVQNVLTTAREQRELFCWKFPEIPREDVTQLMNVSNMPIYDKIAVQFVYLYPLYSLEP